ncbi:hypothetical protein V8C86DRAFT_3140644 [Haematococcus lacustris]
MLLPPPPQPDESWFSEATASTALQHLLSGSLQCGSPQMSALMAEALTQCAAALREGDRPEGPDCETMQRCAEVLLCTLCHWRSHTASAQANTTQWQPPAHGMHLWGVTTEELQGVRQELYGAWEELPCRPVARAMLLAVMAGQPCPELPAWHADSWVQWSPSLSTKTLIDDPPPTYSVAVNIVPNPTAFSDDPPPCYEEAIKLGPNPVSPSLAKRPADGSQVPGVAAHMQELHERLAAYSVQVAAARVREGLLEEEIKQLRLCQHQQQQQVSYHQQQSKQVVMQLQQQVLELQAEVRLGTAANKQATQQAEAAVQQLHQALHLAQALRLQQRACREHERQVMEAEVQQQRSRAERAEAQLHQLQSTQAIINSPTALCWWSSGINSSSGQSTPLRVSLGGSSDCSVRRGTDEFGEGPKGLSLPLLPSTHAPSAAAQDGQGHKGLGGGLAAAMKRVGWALFGGA